ncbi:CPBP family intramembrane glutamic endopeptidase [Pseudoalteromonas obscura]|uniref:CPBP family intramembrane metalloprotease n=1 Tax=Pseudoalteromonas obscura TaxID=3048491 RepID=A0ABT7EJ28_9GAMM|nr:CPBP family intramembrane glutamic endopeptidase [Pseudoalteromonas sp. P94(2023)]MDK2595023.1 CPBP family intramembrane metalloprotease [Pseudoalteromonas sp. P94(2023)]
MFQTFSITRLITYCLVPFLLLSVPVALLLVMSDGNPLVNIFESHIAKLTEMLCFVFSLILILSFFKPRKRAVMFANNLSSSGYWQLTLLAIGLLLLTFAALNLMQLYQSTDLSFVDPPKINRDITPSGSVFWLYISILFLSIVIVSPIFEEVVFRGILLDRLSLKLSPIWAITVSSLLFGFLHHNYLGSTVYGVLLCLVRLRFRSLTAVIFVHILNNLMVFCLILSSYFFDLSRIPIVSTVLVHNPNLTNILLLTLTASLIIMYYYKKELICIPQKRFNKTLLT